MTAKLDFLKSRKFWALIIIAIIGVLKDQMIVSADIANVINTFLYGFIGVNIASKISEGISK